MQVWGLMSLRNLRVGRLEKKTDNTTLLFKVRQNVDSATVLFRRDVEEAYTIL
jgi:hypothetical protein